MLISKENRKQIYQTLFKDGVMVAKKAYNLPSHPSLPSVPNLQVIKALQSLESRGYVKTQFAWQWYYYFLTDAGVQYLREFLHLPGDIVPATYKKSAAISGQQQGGQGGYGRDRGERAGGQAPRSEADYRKVKRV